MPIHRVGLAPPAIIRLAAAPSFHTTCEFAAHGCSTLDDRAFAAATVDCQRGSERSGAQCLDCPRLVSYRAGDGAGEVVLTCAWTDRDPVAARMTTARALVSTTPDAACRDADRVADLAAVHRLIVLGGGQLVGVVCRCDLRAANTDGERVADVMEREVFVIDAAAGLGEAAAAMSALGVGCLPVVRGDFLIGVITRGDLRRAGLPEELIK